MFIRSIGEDEKNLAEHTILMYTENKWKCGCTQVQRLKRNGG